MDQDNVSHSDVPGYTTPPTPRVCILERRAVLAMGIFDIFELIAGQVLLGIRTRGGEIVSDDSETEPLSRLKKWVVAGKLNPSSSMTPRKIPDDGFAEFQAKYAAWNRQYKEMWKHVQEMKRIGKDVAARVTASSIAVKNRELQEMRQAFGLEDAADLARKIHQTLPQQKAERLRTPQLRYDDNWARPGLVDLILRSLPYRTDRTTVVAALREFRGRVSYALDYLMPGNGIADLSDSDSDPGCVRYFDDPPTPGKGIDFDLREDDPLTPWNGIDFDLPEINLPMAGDDPNAQSTEQLWAYMRGLEKRLDRFQEDVASMKTQLNGALQQHR